MKGKSQLKELPEILYKICIRTVLYNRHEADLDLPRLASQQI